MYFPIIDVLKENFIAKIPSIVTQWLTDNVDPVGSAVVVDASLSISGAAADAKITGDEINDLKSDLTNPQEGLKNVLSKYEELIGGFDIENLKKTDSESLKSKIEAIKTELKEGSILEGVGDEYKQKIENLNNDIERVIRSVKNIISINYTTPVGLRGGYGQTGLEIAIDTLKYTREENGDGTVQMTVHADFQLPFSIAEDGANTKIGFIGENIHLVGDGSSKIMLDTKNTTGNFSIAKEIVYFPILDGKAQIGIKKDSYIFKPINKDPEWFDILLHYFQKMKRYQLFVLLQWNFFPIQKRMWMKLKVAWSV